MNYVYQRNITEIKNEFTSFLNDLLTPFIYEGLKSVYVFSIKTHKEYLDKDNSQTRSPGVLKIFQLLLKTIPTLNRNCMETETNRIRNGTKCFGCFDNLVKATIKSKIVLLTFTNPKNYPDILKEKHHDNVDVIDFLHKCYIESARIVYNNPELFWHEFTPLEIKRNQREICELIKLGIGEGIRRVLPLKEILGEYLNSDYDFHESEKESAYNKQDYQNILEMVKDFLNNENMGTRQEFQQRNPEQFQYRIPNKDTSKYIKDGILEESDFQNFADQPVDGRMNRSDTRNDESDSSESGSESDNTPIITSNISNNLENLYDEIASVTNNDNQFFDLVDRVNNIEKGRNNIDIPYKNEQIQTNNENETIGHRGFIPEAGKDTEVQEILKNNSKINAPSNKTGQQLNEMLINMEGNIVKPINHQRLSRRPQNNQKLSPNHNSEINQQNNQSDNFSQLTNLLARQISNTDESKVHQVSQPKYEQTPIVSPQISHITNQNKNVSHIDNDNINEKNKEIFTHMRDNQTGGDLNNDYNVKFFANYMK